MNKAPVLLRRTGSHLPGSASAPSSGGAPAVSGANEVDPDAAIPVADEEPGDFDVAVSSHKRKQSGIPLEAHDIVGRASAMTSLEAIGDEEEGSGGDIGGIQLSQSSSEGGEALGSSERGGSSMPEFGELFPDERGGGLWRSLKSVLASRGAAGATLLMLALAYATVRPASEKHRAAPSASSPGAGAAAGSDIMQPKPGSKEITIGEYHDEEVGAPMEHTVREYNKIQYYDSPDRMKPLHSKGPVPVSDEVGGLHMFENVCLTTNIDALRYRPKPDTGLRGLVYFTEDESIGKNPKRCVPCSNKHPMKRWDGDNEDKSVVGHACGLPGLHAMFGSSVGDWSDCVTKGENAKLMEEWGQTQSPVNVQTVHFFQEPTFALQFDTLDAERSLFDMLLTYLPHWDRFLHGRPEGEPGGEGMGGFPFKSVISHSLEGCLSHSHHWFCEVLHQMYAFGEAKEIPWEGDENTLYCFRELYYNQPGYQRNLDHGKLITKEVFGDFREMLFRKFGLPRRRTADQRKEEAEYEKAHGGVAATKVGANDSASNEPKIIFYDNALSPAGAAWKDMETLVSSLVARGLAKYARVKFVAANDFADLSVAQQARRFNEADAVIMARGGGHMANAVFAVDGTSFVEVGCKVEGPIGNPKFMALMDGKYRAVERCGKDEGVGGKDGAVCVVCDDEGDNADFKMSPDAFEKLVDDVVAGLAG
ncbi:hypothetical protein ACHAWF_006503 [Thalassiosira exigua]